MREFGSRPDDEFIKEQRESIKKPETIEPYVDKAAVRRIEAAFKSPEDYSAVKIGENCLIFEKEEGNFETMRIVKDSFKALSPLLEKTGKKVAFEYGTVSSIYGFAKQEKLLDKEAGMELYKITFNQTFLDINQAPEYILHEIGHLFEEELERIAKENDKVLPEDMGGQLHADLFACAIMRPGEFEFYANEFQMVRDTLWCYKKLMEDVEVETLRTDLYADVEAAKIEQDKLFQKMVEDGAEKEDLKRHFFYWKADDYIFNPITMRMFDYFIMQAEEAEN